MQPTRNFSTGPNVNVNCSQPQQQIIQPKNKPEQMNMDAPNRFKPATNWQRPNAQMNGQQGREHNFSRQHIQEPRKMQRINQIRDNESNPSEVHEDDEYDEIPDNLISISSHGTNKTTTSSAFLEE